MTIFHTDPLNDPRTIAFGRGFAAGKARVKQEDAMTIEDATQGFAPSDEVPGSALQALKDVEAMLGGANGPTIRIRAALLSLRHESQGVFVPHPHCTEPSGACFEQSRCLSQCTARQTKNHEQRILKLERRLVDLELLVHRRS